VRLLADHVDDGRAAVIGVARLAKQMIAVPLEDRPHIRRTLGRQLLGSREVEFDRAYAGESTQSDDIRLIMHRHGYAEEAHFSFFYAPVRDDAGDVVGMFCACNEITDRVLAERRRREEQKLAERQQGQGWGAPYTRQERR
jgi:hypothetical protein